MTKFEKWLMEKGYDPESDILVCSGVGCRIKSGKFRQIHVPSMKGWAMVCKGYRTSFKSW